MNNNLSISLPLKYLQTLSLHSALLNLQQLHTAGMLTMMWLLSGRLFVLGAPAPVVCRRCHAQERNPTCPTCWAACLLCLFFPPQSHQLPDVEVCRHKSKHTVSLQPSIFPVSVSLNIVPMLIRISHTN